MRGFIMTRTQRVYRGTVGIFTFELPNLTVVDTIKVRPYDPATLLVTSVKWDDSKFEQLAYPSVPAEMFAPEAMRCPLYIGPHPSAGSGYFQVKLLNNGETGARVLVGVVGSIPITSTEEAFPGLGQTAPAFAARHVI